MRSPKTYTLAFLVTGFPPDVSGVSHFNWERAHWFANQEQYRVIVFAPDWQQRDRTLTSPDSNKNLIIERYPSKPWAPYPLTHVPKFSSANLINKKLMDYKPDLIVMTDVERYFLLGAWQLPGRAYARNHNVPYIAEYHTDLYNFSAAYPGWQWLRSIARSSQLASYLYRQIDVTICSSAAASKSCQELGVPNIETIPFLGIDVSTYSPARRDRKALTWLSPAEKNNKVLLFLGRLGFEKRVDLLIDAFARLKQRSPNCSLIIAGDGPDNVVNQLKQRAALTSDIHFTGFLLGDTKANLLASCDVFCSPSPYETFGRTVVEAMASGIPVVTVNSGAVSEYILDNVNGYLSPPNDPQGLANRIHNVLFSDTSAVTQRAVQNAKEFSLEQGCQNLNRYYQKLLGINQEQQALKNYSRL